MRRLSSEAPQELPPWRLCRVVENRALAPGVVLLWLDAPQAARLGQPGQFLQVAIPGNGYDPLLRRPISIGLLEPGAGRLGLIIRAAGRGTSILAATKPGDELDILGPLGAGFPLPHEGRSLLVGGGIGSAPLFGLATALIGGDGVQTAETRVLMLNGARTHSELWADELAAQLGVPALAATDDGSAGHHGLVTELMREQLAAGDIQTVFACGPEPMLRAVKELAQQSQVGCYVSLEQRMACGVGACFGCSWPRTEQAGGGYVRVCRDGPVFAAEEVLL